MFSYFYFLNCISVIKTAVFNQNGFFELFGLNPKLIFHILLWGRSPCSAVSNVEGAPSAVYVVKCIGGAVICYSETTICDKQGVIVDA